VSDPSFGLIMLGLIVVAIMMGYPTAFTLMGLGMAFGFLAFWIPGAHWYDNRVFDLIAQRTYGVMTNDTLLSVPLFVFMGYVMERAALVDRMFHSVQLAFRRVPASLAVTTLLVCAFWGIASGIVGAVVVLMGVIALRPMLKAGYDIKLASGAITAGGTLGILIPPSVMIIVYAAVAGQSIVKLYAAAMLPGFFLTFLYLVYILGWAMINPKIAPKLAPSEYRVAVPESLLALERGPKRRIVPGLLAALVKPRMAGTAGYRTVLANVGALAVPVVLTAGTLGATWWYVVVYNAPEVVVAAPAPAPLAAGAAVSKPAVPLVKEEQPQALGSPASAEKEEPPQELGAAQVRPFKEPLAVVALAQWPAEPAAVQGWAVVRAAAAISSAAAA
jgi:TRAP-type mannitol/chloroaromatic compound transport system permease large subunit